MIDIHFIEFYIEQYYKCSVVEYFKINKSTASLWRNSKFPNKRLKEFYLKEGTLDVHTLLSRIYSDEKLEGLL